MTNLDRAPHAYRVGYWDATAHRPRRTDKKDGIETPFVGHDYNEGYDAGFNDVYWYAHDAKRCTLWEPTTVRPVVVHKIAKGKAWGKTHAVASKAFWDFEAGDWKTGA